MISSGFISNVTSNQSVITSRTSSATTTSRLHVIWEAKRKESPGGEDLRAGGSGEGKGGGVSGGGEGVSDGGASRGEVKMVVFPLIRSKYCE